MRTIACPICRKPVPLDGPEMPFCSERCRLLDLGNWAMERYVLSRPISDDDEEAIARQLTSDEQ